MIQRIIAIVAGMLLSVAGSSAQIQGKGPKVLTLQECLRLARENNLDIQRAEAQLLGAGARLTAAFGRYLPSLSLSAGYSRRLDQQQQQFVNIGGQLIPVPRSPANSYSLSVSASLPLFDGFAREAQFAQAQDQLQATELQAADTRRRVFQQVYDQFLEVQKAYRLIDLRKADLETAKTQLRKLEAQYEAGRIAKPALYQQQAQVAQKQLALVQAQNQLTLAKAKLLSLIGLSPTLSVEFSSAGLPDTVTAAMMQDFRQRIGTFQTVYQQALSRRPDYLAAQKQLAIANASLTVARSGYFPSLSAALSWSWANSELRDFDRLGRTFVGLSLRVPIFDNFRTNEQIQSANVQRMQRELELRQIEQQIAADIEQAFLQLDASERELQAATVALDAARLNYASAQERLDVGKISLAEYAQANSQFTSAKVNYLTALFNYLKARYQLKMLTGTEP